MVEPGHDLVEAVGEEAGGGELDGQGQAVEAAHEVGDAGSRRLGVEGGVDGPGPLDEQADRRGVAPLGGEHGHPAHVLARDPEALAAGGHEPQSRAAAQQALDEVRERGEHVLAVVEQHDELGVADHARHLIDRVHGRTEVDAQRPGERGRDGAGVRGRQLAQHHRSVGIGGAQVVPDLEEQPRLPDTTRPDQGHQPGRRDDGGRFGLELLPADQRGGRQRERGGTGPVARGSRVGSGEDRVVLGDERGGGFDAELVAEPPTEVVVGPQCLGAPTDGRERVR